MNIIATMLEIIPPAIVNQVNILFSLLVNITANIPNATNPTIPYIGLSTPRVLPYELVCTTSHPFVPVIAEQILL